MPVAEVFACGRGEGGEGEGEGEGEEEEGEGVSIAEWRITSFEEGGSPRLGYSITQ